MDIKDLYQEAARLATGERGSVEIIRKHPFAMKVTFPDGVAVYTHKREIPLNSKTTREFLKDKDLTVRMLEAEGIHTPRSMSVKLTRKHFANPDKLKKSKQYGDIIKFVREVGFPVFLKPNKGSQGKNVFRISDKDTLKRLLVGLSDESGKADYILQEACIGKEYRVVVVKGKALLAYHRHPLEVTGDGIRTLKELIRDKLDELRSQGRKILLDEKSEKIKVCVEEQGFKFKDVPEPGKIVQVIANNNLSDGASPILCTQEIQKRYKDLFSKLYKMGIEYYGLDLIEDVRTGKPVPYIIEINGSPGYGHFLKADPMHKEILKGVLAEGLRAAHRKLAEANKKKAPVPPANINIQKINPPEKKVG